MARCTDPTCPCQDGCACNYVAVGDSPAWPLPPGVELLPVPIVSDAPDAVTVLRWRNEWPTSGPGWPD